MRQMLWRRTFPLRSILWLALVSALALATVPIAAWATQPTVGPWVKGDHTADGWRVTAVTAHPEFVRYELSLQGKKTGVEIVSWRGAQGPFTAKRYRIQPAPGADIDEALLGKLVGELRTWEQTKGSAQPALATRGTAEALAGFDAVAIALLLLNSLAVGLALWLGAVAVRGSPELLPWAIIAVLGAVASWVWLFALHGAGDIPVSWITILHEGPTAQNIEILYGRNRHTGPNHHFLVWLLADTPSFGLRDIVRMNLWLTSVQAGLLVLLARAMLGHIVPAVVLMSFFILAPVSRYAAVSELAGPATSVYLLLGAVVVGALPHPERAPRHLRIAAVVTLVALTALTGLTRTETAGFGLIALPWLLARIVVGDDRLEAMLSWGLSRLLAWRWWGRVTLLAAVAATLPAMWTPGRIGWLIAGAHPLNPSVLSAPLFLLAVLPVGAVALVCLGSVQAVRRWRTFGALLLATAVLYRVYFCASHRVFYEMVRYTATLMPAFALLSLLGWRELEGIAMRRGWGARWRQAAMAAIAAALLVPTLPEASVALWDHRPGALPAEGMLDADQQVEMRALVSAVQTHPECVIATRVTGETERVQAPARYEWRLFGGPLRAPKTVSESKAGAADLAGQVPEARCMLFFVGLDCHLLHGRDCVDATEGRTRVGGVRRVSKPYNDGYEYGEVRAQLDLGLYRLK